MTTISSSQNRRIWQLLNETEETAWRDEYVSEASNGRVSSVKAMTMEEAHVMRSLLDDVKQGLKQPCNPHSSLAAKFKHMAHTLAPVQSKESNQDKLNRLRRNVLRYCHEMGTWYLKDADQNIVLKNGKPVFDYSAIDAYCLTHSAAKKKLNDHNVDELTKLIFQFKKMTQNTIYKPEK